MRNLIIVFILLLVGGFFYNIGKAPVASTSTSEIINVLEDPVVQPIKGSDIIKTVGGIDFEITQKAKYKIAGIVVSTSTALDDDAKGLSPIDLGIVWGKLADKNMYKYLNYSHYDRVWNVAVAFESPLGESYSHSHLSNNHIIPSNDNILKAIKESKGKGLLIEGCLVDVRAQLPNGTFIWDSDSNPSNPGCEIIYVTKVIMNNKVYE